MYQPKYTITSSILKNVGYIEAAREVVENAALVPAWEAQFRRDAILRTVHYGTHIEGNPLSKEQVEEVVRDDEGQASALSSSVVARERDIQEVLNYREVLRFIDGQGVPVESSYGRIKTEFSPYTMEILMEIHRLTTKKVVPDDEQGKLRRVQVIIRNKANGDVVFRPPPPPAVPMQLAEFLEWLNSPEGREHHPALRAGITHWELVRIHPFTEGNGRTARAMALLVLFQEGYDIKRFFSIEQFFDQNPREYYDALSAVGMRKDGDVTAWLEYFVEGLAIELSRVKDRVLALSRDLKLKGKLGRQVPLTERQIRIMEFMEVNGRQLTTKDTFKVIPMVSRDTILRDLNYLIEKGIVKKMGRTKGARYVLL